MEKRSMREEIALIAGPMEWGDTRQSWLARAARKVPVPFRTMKALFYGEIADPRHWAARDVAEAADKIRRRAEEEALAARFSSLATTLDKVDADFFGADIDALRAQVRRLRRESST